MQNCRCTAAAVAVNGIIATDATIADIACISGIAVADRRLRYSDIRYRISVSSAVFRRITPEPLSCVSDSYALSVHDTELS